MTKTDCATSTISKLKRGLLAGLMLAAPVSGGQAQATTPMPMLLKSASSDATLASLAAQAATSADPTHIGDLMQIALWTPAGSMDGVAAKCHLGLRCLDVIGWHWTMEYLLVSIDRDAERLS